MAPFPPLVPTSFVGRAEQAARLARLLDGAAVMTVVGPAGVGKTRLALEVARAAGERFPDGVRFVDLSPLHSVDRTTIEVARLVGVTAGAGDPVALAAEQLGDRRVLLIVDNCEHLVDGVARLVHRLVSACPQVRVLATSREPLALGAEVTLVLPPLATADAVALLLDRARAAGATFAAGPADPDPILLAGAGPEAGPTSEGDAGPLAALCERLDGRPLAIELAAPWASWPCWPARGRRPRAAVPAGCPPGSGRSRCWSPRPGQPGDRRAAAAVGPHGRDARQQHPHRVGLAPADPAGRLGPGRGPGYVVALRSNADTEARRRA